MARLPAKRKKTNSLSAREGKRLFVMIIPFLVLVVMFSYVPLAGWVYAFVDYKPGFPLSQMEFVGLKWFQIPFSNPVLRNQLLNTLKNTLAINGLYLVALVCPMVFAILLNEIRRMRFRKVVQTLTTLPHFIGWVLVYAAFFAVLSSEGLLNHIFIGLGLRDTTVNYLALPDHQWLKMLGLHLWKNLGWNAIMYIAAISAIDAELYEAADIDGAGRFAKIWYVTVPHLIPTFFVLFLLQVGNMLNNGMDQFYVFSNAMTKDKIEVLDLYIYNNGLKTGQIAYSTAIGMFKSVISLVLLFSGNALSKLVRNESIF